MKDNRLVFSLKMTKIADELKNQIYNSNKMADKLISKIPDGPLAEKWTKRKSEIHLVSPNNKRKLEIIVVGTGLGGASAAASLGELGYNVKVFCISDSPRRAHSIAAQGGINAAKNYQNDNEYTVLRKSAQPSSTSALRRVFRSRANTAATWPTAPSEASR